MRRTRLRRCVRCAGPCAIALWWCTASAAAGSWSATLRGPRVAGPDRSYAGAPFTPPAIATDARVRRVHWRYALPPGRELAVELCANRDCVPVTGTRGSSEALAGTDADVPLAFRFRLPAGERRPVQVGAIELSVDYQ